MAMYVDVETSPEALQDDAELMEAVHELVVNISTVAKAEIANEVSDLVAYLNERLEHYLPLLYVYQREPQRLRDDCERLLLFALLVAAAVWFLAPKRQVTPTGNVSSIASSSPHGSSQVTASSNQRGNGWFRWRSSRRVEDDEEDELQNLLRLPHDESYHSNDDFPSCTTTDEERFERMYTESILHSGYSKLVLPPTCRLIPVTTSNSSSRLQRHSSQTAANGGDSSSSSIPLPATDTAPESVDGVESSSPSASTNDDDNPVARLQYYLRQVWLLNRSLLRFDYMTAGSTLWHWVASLQRLRQVAAASPNTPPITTSDLASPEDRVAVPKEADTTLSAAPTTAVATTTAIDAAENDTGDSLPRNRLDTSDSVSLTTKDEVDENKDLSPSVDETKRTPIRTINEAKSMPSIPPSVKFADQTPSIPTTIPWIKSMPLVTNGRHQSDGSVYFDSPWCDEEKDDPASEGEAGPIESSCEGDSIQGATADKVCQSTPLSISPIAADDALTTTTETSWRRSRQNGADSAENGIGRTQRDSTVAPTIDWDTTNITTDGDLSLMEDEGQTSVGVQPTRMPTRNQLMMQSVSATKRNDSSTSSPSSSRRHYFDAAQTHLSIHKMSVECPVPDKNGYVLGDAFLPDSTRYTPLLVFVNSRSGPQQGPLLIAQLRRLLNPIQVWDLAHGGPRPILESFLVFSRLRLLVCGGDGTVSWIIQTLEDMQIHDQRQYPPIAILPLGTGNDLARIHGWGGGYNYESLITILEQISESYSSLLDRWEVTIHESKGKKPKEIKGFFNYLGVGADAQAALQVHYLRESRPDWFFSRVINKAMYGLFGAEDIIKATTVNVRREIKLIADGVEVPLPPDSQGIILLNIDAYAGGVPLWSHGVRPKDVSATPSPRRTRSMSEVDQTRTRLRRFDRVDSVDELQNITSVEERFAHVTACDMPSSCQDGFLDVVSIRGAFHLGQIKVGLSNAQRLCQCREATIIIRNKVAVQVDGEPWRQNSCQLTIKRKKDPAVMLHRSADDGGVETEMSKLLDWAEARNMIDGQVHSILMKEFSRRIESKKRQRRVRQSDNIMSTLKKAMSSGAMANNGSGHSNWQGGGGIAF